MNNIQKQSLMIIIQGMEHQLQSLKSLLFLKDGEQEEVRTQPARSMGRYYTSAEEDRMIEEALEAPQDKEELLLQNVFKQAQEKKNLDGSIE